MLQPPTIPGLFITGTDTEVGKTIVTGAIAQYFHRRGLRVGVFKPAASGCLRRREGLVSEDAEFLAHCGRVRFPLDVICPQRYLEPLAPAIAAERAREPLDWAAVRRALATICQQSDVLLVEGVGGLMVPMDAKHTVLDMAGWLKLSTVVVARPNLGTISHTLLTVRTLRSAGVPVAGVVINRYPAESPTVAEETNPRAIEKWGQVPVLCVVPDEPIQGIVLPEEITAAIDTVAWEELATVRR